MRYTAEENPIANDLPQWTTINEELYNNSTGKLLSSASELARGKQSYKTKKGDEVKEVTQDFAVIWTNNYRDTTRVFATTLGHNTATVADERYLDLVTRGCFGRCEAEPAYLKTK
ncbi:MAG: ThuA domain-containing protein [Pirellulales bacterium]